ncbi:hypothetical protein RHGRI_000384 [Rhododendron griersonianum]|uniref:Uncharacterized protein n=1 Tax=Rhododendron griersonianum TaxID=479676 RepID=A0AAV6LGR3_9ERIC|nr:hypothetical protein RHGRI_000384 [Rhododendron griersonianum]KAG5564174.1 hypothetical protein RHGRI_000384 [Rhododendron griersonianum]
MMISSDSNGDVDEEEDYDGENEYHRVFDYCFSDLPKITLKRLALNTRRFLRDYNVQDIFGQKRLQIWWGWLVVMMEYIDSYCTNACREVLGKKMVVEWLLNVLSRPLILESTIGGSTMLGNGQRFCLPVASICQVMLSHNGSEHVLSSCGEENGAKEHLGLGHCFDKAIVHDDKSLGRRNGRMRLSGFHGILHGINN